ncbi:MAG: hypothetical protein K6E18_09305 [Lachnospiraceae bacterium]|nr:hypothetical protein [Lachnospiraceae bacterium]
MEELLTLLGDGHARTIEHLAMELDTSIEDVERKIEFLEHAGRIRRVVFCRGGCNGCSGCSTKGSDGVMCKGCMPENGFQNMGVMWEVCKA